MNPKYLEHIVVYLSVLVVCVLIGLLARMIVVGAGVDEFTATTVFWAVTALGMIVYGHTDFTYRRTFFGYAMEVFSQKGTTQNHGNYTYSNRKFGGNPRQATATNGR